jgi:hypothetical protein
VSSTFGTDSAVRNWARQVQQKLKMLGEIWKSFFCYWYRTQRKCEYKTNYCRKSYNGIWWDIDDDKTQRLRSHYFQTDPSTGKWWSFTATKPLTKHDLSMTKHGDATHQTLGFNHEKKTSSKSSNTKHLEIRIGQKYIFMFLVGWTSRSISYVLMWTNHATLRMGSPDIWRAGEKMLQFGCGWRFGNDSARDGQIPLSSVS